MDAMLIIVIVGIAAVLGTVSFVGIVAVVLIYGGQWTYRKFHESRARSPEVPQAERKTL